MMNQAPHKIVTMPQAPPSGLWYPSPAGPVVVCTWPGCHYTVGGKHHKDAEYEFEKHVRGFHMRHNRENYILGRRGVDRVNRMQQRVAIEPTITLPEAPRAVPRQSRFIPRKVA